MNLISIDTTVFLSNLAQNLILTSGSKINAKSADARNISEIITYFISCPDEKRIHFVHTGFFCKILRNIDSHRLPKERTTGTHFAHGEVFLRFCEVKFI